MSANMKPADELATVRERIKMLKAREDDLRAYLLAHPEECAGDMYMAEVVHGTRRTFDRAAAEKALGSLDAYTRETETTTLRIVERVGEYE